MKHKILPAAALLLALLACCPAMAAAPKDADLVWRNYAANNPEIQDFILEVIEPHVKQAPSLFMKIYEKPLTPEIYYRAKYLWLKYVQEQKLIYKVLEAYTKHCDIDKFTLRDVFQQFIFMLCSSMYQYQAYAEDLDGLLAGYNCDRSEFEEKYFSLELPPDQRLRFARGELTLRDICLSYPEYVLDMYYLQAQ